MIKISTLVEQMVKRSPFLSEALSEGMINVSALARKLQPELGQRLGREVGEGAIIMAIKRMPLGGWGQSEKSLQDFFKKLNDISVRSNLIAYNFQNSPTLMDKQVGLLDHIRRFPKGFCTFSQGVSETTIIVGEMFEAFTDKHFHTEKLLNKRDRLSSITLLLPTENRSLYGIYYYILKELAYQGINLIELISTSNEFTIIVVQEDLNQAFKILNDLRMR
jgi:hypothetical protein